MTTITVTEYERLFGVVCVGENDCYIFGDNNSIAAINIKGQITGFMSNVDYGRTVSL